MLSFLSNLRVRFLGLALVAVLPALVLLILSANEQRDQALTVAQTNAVRVADLAAANQGRVIESTRQLLVVLSRLPETRETGPACDTLMQGLNNQFPVYATLGVVDLDGALVCSAIPPAGSVNFGDRVEVQGPIATGAFTVGNYQTSPETGAQVLPCGFPVVDAVGTTIGVAYAEIDLATLAQEFAADAGFGPNAVLTVFDRQGNALIRQPPLEGFVGQSLVATPGVATALAEGSSSAEVPGADRTYDQREGDTRYLSAYVPLGEAGAPSAYLSFAVPRDDVVKPAEDAFSANLTRLGLVVAAILIGTWVGADLLIRNNTDAYKVLVRRIYDAFGSGGVDLLDEVVAEDFRDHDPMPGQAEGLAGLKQAVALFRAAFPDGEMLVDDMVAEGNKVVSRVTMRGTQRGTFFGQPATGQVVSAEGIEVYRIDKGKVVEGWSRFVPPLLEADDEPEPDPEAPAVPAPRAPELTLGSVAGALARGLRGRRPGRRAS